MQGITLVMAILAVQDLVFMKDPVIINYTKPLTAKEKTELVPIKLDDYDYIIAF